MSALTYEQFYRMKALATYSAKKASTYTYKSGINKGQTKNIGARSASLGLIGVSEKTIWQWVREGKFPPPIKLGSVTVWRATDIQTWMLSRGLEA